MWDPKQGCWESMLDKVYEPSARHHWWCCDVLQWLSHTLSAQMMTFHCLTGSVLLEELDRVLDPVSTWEHAKPVYDGLLPSAVSLVLLDGCSSRRECPTIAVKTFCLLVRAAGEIKALRPVKKLCYLISECCAMWAESTVESKMYPKDSKGQLWASASWHWLYLALVNRTLSYFY